MGYTHYWTRGTLTPTKFAEWSNEVRKIIAHAATKKIAIAGWDGEGDPEITNSVVSFNGEGDESFESFKIDRDNTNWAFCKTGHRPYDVVVGSALLRAHDIFGDKFEVSSDGEWDREDEWVPVRKFYEEVFGQPAKHPKSIRLVS